jgi:hypothetical protein
MFHSWRAHWSRVIPLFAFTEYCPKVDNAYPEVRTSAQSFGGRICGAVSAMMGRCDENAQHLLVNAMMRCVRGTNPASM